MEKEGIAVLPRKKEPEWSSISTPIYLKSESFRLSSPARRSKPVFNAFQAQLEKEGLLPAGKRLTPVILTSPFLRTIQTAYHIASALDYVFENTLFLQDELKEFLWDQEEFDKDPQPILFSKTRTLEEFGKYGLDFSGSKLKLGKSLFENPAFLYPVYPEKEEACQERVARFVNMIPQLFFSKFRANEYVLVWVSHQYCLAAAIWSLAKLSEESFPDELVQLCGILDVRYEEPDSDLLKYKILQRGTNEHLKA